MQYRENPKNGDRLSCLGLGCMRFPKKGSKIDQDKATEMVADAIERGVNYFDTAYIYPGSEEALGKALHELGRRRDVKISTKLPIFMCRTGEDFDRMLDKQLKRLHTDYVDYYFMHMLTDVGTWRHLCSLGIEDWLRAKRDEGCLRNVGFSYHGGRLAFKELVGERAWDFCMVQFNYLDENNQAGYEGVTYAYENGLPVFVMEPLRGGYLADGLPANAKSPFKAVDKNRSMADWGLRWVLNHSEITLLLSGMSSVKQLEENAQAVENAIPDHLSDEEMAAYKQALKAIRHVYKVPCTGCGYCLPCPKGVDIPTCFSSYNDSYSTRYRSALMKYYQTTGLSGTTDSGASQCVGCGKCERHCPQNIGISRELARVRRRMHTKVFHALARFIKP